MRPSGVQTFGYPVNYTARTTSFGGVSQGSGFAADNQKFAGNNANTGAAPNLGMQDMVQQMFSFFVMFMQSLGFKLPEGMPNASNAKPTDTGNGKAVDSNGKAVDQNGKSVDGNGKVLDTANADNHNCKTHAHNGKDNDGGNAKDNDGSRNGKPTIPTPGPFIDAIQKSVAGNQKPGDTQGGHPSGCCCHCCRENTDYNSGHKAGVTGDPHLTGFDGEKYDVMGENLAQDANGDGRADGRVYNMLSDQGLQYNTRFIPWGQDGASVIGEAGLQVGNDRIFFDVSGQAPTLNNQAMNVGQQYQLDGGTATWDGQHLVVNTSEYNVNLQVLEPNHPNGAYLDSNVTINQPGPFADGIAPHGLLGQTADGDGQAHVGQRAQGQAADAGKQGGTVIDGAISDYEVADLWSNDFRYNRFNG